MNFNENKMSFEDVVTNVANVQALSHMNAEDKTVRFTSNRMEKLESNVTFAYVRFSVINGEINKNDLANVTSYINGELVETEVLEGRSAADVNSDVAIYPNPTLSSFFVDSKEDADVQIFDLSGKQIGNTLKVSSTQSLEVNTEVFTSGVYVVKVSNDKFVSTKKVVIKK